MVLVPAVLAVHLKVTLFTVVPVPSALFQLPPATSLTVNELSSPIPTVVRSVLPAGLAQPLVTVIAGPLAGGFCIGVGWSPAAASSICCFCSSFKMTLRQTG